MRFPAAVTLALTVAMLTTVLSRPLLAQGCAPASPDSLPSDSIPADSAHRGPHHPPWMPLVLPGIFVVGAVVMLAPAPLARWISWCDTTVTGVMHDRRAAYVSVGGRFADGETWANAAAIEIVRNPFHVQLHAEHFWGPRHLRYLSARAGPLWRPTRVAVGGATLGYVHTQGDRRLSGVEIGFPLFLGDSTRVVRIEPTWVLARRGLLWNSRLQIQVDVPRTPYFAGFSYSAKSFPFTSESDESYAVQAAALLFGIRY